MARFFLFFALLILASSAMSAQSSSCYQRLRSDGLEFLRKKKYSEAQAQFWAALVSCDDKPANHDLNELIQRAQKNWIDDLETAVKTNKRLYDEAQAANEKLSVSQKNEADARQKAEENAQLALKLGRQAESQRLALLADNLRQKGQKSDAFLLASLALQLAGAEASPSMWRAFGEAVRDSLSQPIAQTTLNFEEIRPLADGQNLLLKTSDQAVFLLEKDGSKKSIHEASSVENGLVLAKKHDFFLLFSGNTAQLFDEKGQAVASFEGHAEPIRFAAFSPDEQFVVTTSRDNSARVFDLHGNLKAVLLGHLGNVYSAEMDAKNQTILTRSSDGSAGLWDFSGKKIASFSLPNSPYLYDAQLLGFAEKVATIAADGRLLIWTKSGQCINETTAEPTASKQLFYAPSAKRLVVGVGSKSVFLYDFEGKLVRSLAHPSEVRGLRLSPDGSKFFTWDAQHTLRLWNLEGEKQAEITAHLAEIAAAEWSPDGQFLLTTAADGTAKLWDLAGNQLLDWALQTTSAPAAARFSTDGKSILVVAKNGRSVERTPIPSVVFQKIGKDDLAFKRLKAAYQIEFFD